MTLQEFFFHHPVFTYEEFRSLGMEQEARNHRTVDSLLAYHLRKGHLLRIRRRLFVSVPPGLSPEEAQIDPYLIAAKLSPDAVLGYHTALEFHGKAYSTFHRSFFLTSHAIRSSEIRGHNFIGVVHPKALTKRGREAEGVESAERMGLPVRVSSLERTLVDLFDRPDLGGGWEEIWRSVEAIEFFKLDQIIEYVLLLDNATTVAKVGFFLEQHRERLYVSEDVLERLQAHSPRKPHYLIRRSSRKDARLVARWNIIVPESLLRKSWEEPS